MLAHNMYVGRCDELFDNTADQEQPARGCDPAAWCLQLRLAVGLRWY